MFDRLLPRSRTLPVVLPVHAGRLTCRRLRQPTPLPTLHAPGTIWAHLWRRLFRAG